jgi:hypothetical protein
MLASITPLELHVRRATPVVELLLAALVIVWVA